MNPTAESAAPRILLIGCGDIAHRLSQKVASATFWGVRRKPPHTNNRIHYLIADATDLNSLSAVIPEDIDYLVITMTPSERSDTGYRRAYVDTVTNLIEIAQLETVSRVFFASSTSVYGQNSGEWVDENSQTTPVSFTGERLLEAEQTLLDSPLSSTIVRFSGIYGPGRLRLLQQAITGHEKDSDNCTYSNRIHSEDCASVLAHLIDMDQRGQSVASCYLASDKMPVPLALVKQWLRTNGSPAQDFEQKLAQEVHRTSSSNAREPRFNKRCCNQRLVDSGYQFIHPDFRSGYRELMKTNSG